MKKKLFLLSMLAALMTFTFVACSSSSDSDEDGPSQAEFADQYFTIENGTYHNGEMPESDTDEEIQGIQMNDQALASGSNFIEVNTDQEFDRFYVGIQGQGGYMEMPVTSSRAGDFYYLITITYGASLSRTITMVIKARTRDGRVTKAYIKVVRFVESVEGDLTINLTFNKKKDLDLHLKTPSGKHIYWGNETYQTEDGVIYGLDHDSNANCNIDGLNNENIVIPDEAIEDGTYQVYLELYKNCDKSIGTDMNWQVAVRYKGNLVKNTRTLPSPGENGMAFTDGHTTVESASSLGNPVTGCYPHDHAGRTQTYVIDFKINRTRGARTVESWSIFEPTIETIAKWNAMDDE